MNLQTLALSLALVSTQAARLLFAKFSPSVNEIWRLGANDWELSIKYLRLMDSLGMQIHFWTDDDAGNTLFSVQIIDFIINNLNHIKRISGVHGVYKNKSMDSNNVFQVEERVFILKTKVSWIRALPIVVDWPGRQCRWFRNQNRCHHTR